MESTFRGLGWGVVRLIISGLAGLGVGLITVGRAYSNTPADWPRYTPPPGVFEGVGAGLLTAAGCLFLVFVVPWMLRADSGKETDPLQRLVSGLGSGLIKLLIALLAGGGTVCLLVGSAASTNPAILRGSEQGPLMFAIGTGVLVVAVLLVVLFVIPWLLRPAAEDRPAETPPGNRG